MRADYIERLRQRARLVFGGEHKNEMLASGAAFGRGQALRAGKYRKTGGTAARRIYAARQYFKPENRRRCIEALIRANRTDLIGTGKDCLVKPDEQYNAYLREKAAKQRDSSRKNGRNDRRNTRNGNKWQKEDQRKKKH